MTTVEQLGSRLPTSRAERTERIVVRRSWITERNTLRVASIVLMLAIWEIVGLNINPLFLPTPTAVASSIVHLTANGELLPATWESLKIFLMGFLLAAVLGVLLGLLCGMSRLADGLLDILLTIFWATPTIALLPLVVIWFGLTTSTQVIIVFLSTLFPVVVETSVAVRHVDESLVRVAHAFGATTRQRVVHVVIPSAVPYIVSGLRIAVGRAVIGVIVAELFTSSTGLGGKMTYYSNYFQTANYFAALVIFVIFSLLITEAIALIDRRYRRSRREVAGRG